MGSRELKRWADPASARYSRWRENQATMMLASTPKASFTDDHRGVVANASLAIVLEQNAVNE